MSSSTVDRCAEGSTSKKHVSLVAGRSNASEASQLVTINEEEDEDSFPNAQNKASKSIWDIDGLDDDEVSETESNDDQTSCDQTDTRENLVDENIVFIPAPRQKTTFNFKHTPRVFNTPMRESKRGENVSYGEFIKLLLNAFPILDDEDEWIAKNLSHLKKQRELAGDTRHIGERDPFWLKGKGDEFYR